jgi:hypothetical protein
MIKSAFIIIKKYNDELIIAAYQHFTSSLAARKRYNNAVVTAKISIIDVILN